MVMGGRFVNGTKKLTKDGKEVILVPMDHYAKQKKYDEVRNYLDILKADGYVTFNEAVLFKPFHIDTISDISIPKLKVIYDSLILSSADSLLLDTLERKARRIIGQNIGLKPEFVGKRKISQVGVLGLDTEQDIWVDYSLFDLIKLYEKEYGPVPLSDYDFETDLDDPKYKSSKSSGKTDKYGFLKKYRDDLILRRVLESKHDKIVLVYGMSHTWTQKNELRHLNGFTLDKKYKAKKVK